MKTVRDVIIKMTTCGNRMSDFERCPDCKKQVDKALADIRAAMPSVENLAQLLLDVKMKEMRRNHGGSSYHEEGYKIKEICSCGYCHMSYLEATAIRELMISKLQ